MKYRNLILLFVTIFFSNSSYAQILITKNFEFKDGVYLSLKSLQKNKPDLSWTEVKTNLAANPQTYMAQVEYVEVKASSDTLQEKEIYAICLGGIPFIQLQEGEGRKELMTFAGLQTRGRLAYYTYEEVVVRKKPFSAYNPLNGRAFRTAFIERKELVVFEKILNFATGETYELNRENLLMLVQEDAELLRAVEAIKEGDLSEKLFKSLLIYDDRHPIYIKED